MVRRFWLVALCVLMWLGALAVRADSPQLGILVAANRIEPQQNGVLQDLLVNVVTQRAQLNLDTARLPIEVYDASRYAHLTALQKIGVDYSKLVSIGVCTMHDGVPVKMLTLQGPVTDVNASVSVTMRRVQFLMTLEALTPPIPESVPNDTLDFDYRYENGPVVHSMRGSIKTPLRFWNELALLQPPPGAHGPYGLPRDDELLGQRSGFGLRQLGKLARLYLRFDSLDYRQPPTTDHYGLQVGTFTDSQQLTDTSLGAALFDLRPRFERDLRAHLHLGTP